MHMANLPSDSNGDTRAKPNQREAPGVPRWVKVSGIIVIALVLIVVILHLTGNGFGSHMPSLEYWSYRQ
jgi:hypothetical protein